jgi:hypothetical protein
MKTSYWVMVGVAVAAVLGVYLYATRVGGLADVLPLDPAYTDGASIDQGLASADQTVDLTIDPDLADNDTDAATF